MLTVAGEAKRLALELKVPICARLRFQHSTKIGISTSATDKLSTCARMRWVIDVLSGQPVHHIPDVDGSIDGPTCGGTSTLNHRRGGNSGNNLEDHTTGCDICTLIDLHGTGTVTADQQFQMT